MKIPPRDEAALDWYFGEGQTLFLRSSTGDMLDRADLYIVDPPWDREMAIAREQRRPNEPPPDALTASPTGSTVQGGGSMPQEAALRRFALVATRLKAVDEADSRRPAAVNTLAAYYGDAGARWGGKDEGRIFAVLPHTRSGAELIRVARARMEAAGHTDQGLGADEVLHNEVVLQRHRHDSKRRKLLDGARREAWSLYRHAAEVWRATDASATRQPTDRQTAE